MLPLPYLKAPFKNRLYYQNGRGWGTGRPGVLAGGAPQTGTTPPKNPPLGGKRQDPRNLADTGMASQGQEKKGILPLAKNVADKGQAV